MADVLVIRCKSCISPKLLKAYRDIFLAEKESGIIVLPDIFEAIVVPDDVEIRVEGGEESND